MTDGGLDDRVNKGAGNRPGMADNFQQLGIVVELQDRLDEAEDRIREALAINERIGNLRGTAANYHQLGVIAERRGRTAEAESWFERSRAIH